MVCLRCVAGRGVQRLALQEPGEDFLGCGYHGVFSADRARRSSRSRVTGR